MEGELPLQVPAKTKKGNPGIWLPKVRNLIYRIAEPRVWVPGVGW